MREVKVVIAFLMNRRIKYVIALLVFAFPSANKRDVGKI